MSELRHDPLAGRWVILSPGRLKRPRAHNGNVSNCPFCPGNEHMTPPEILRVTSDNHNHNCLFKCQNKDKNWLVRVVPNKFPALAVEGDLDREGIGIYDRMNGVGAHEVIIERQKHIEIWEDSDENNFWLFKSIILRMKDLEKDKRFKYLLVYKNYKEEAGASLAHPHFQLNALPVTPLGISMELDQSRKYFCNKERCLLCDTICQEEREATRVICENENFISFCPYASRYVFEIMIAPKKNKHNHNFSDLDDAMIFECAQMLSKNLKSLSAALDDSALNLVIHTAPFFRTRRKGYGGTLKEDFHWHIHIYPRVSKQAGLELGSEIFINSALPEEAAELLRIKLKGDR